jgi:PGF-CTERM protein
MFVIKYRFTKIIGIFALMLIASIFVLPVTADIPIKLKLTAQSHVYPGDTEDITVMLLDENNNPAMDESDVSIYFSTNLGQVSSPLIIPAGKNSSVTQFTSKVTGIAVISVKSKGLIGDTASVEVSTWNVSQPTQSPTASLTLLPAPTPTPMGVPGFEAGIAIAGLLAVAYLVLRQRK